MKKLLGTLTVFILLSLSIIGLSACGHEHVFTDTVVTPTCTEDGYTLRVCECGEEQKEEVTTAKGHKFTEKNATNDYSKGAVICGQKIEYYYSCVCGEKGTQTFEYGINLGHHFNADGCTRCDFRFDKDSKNVGVNPLDEEIESIFSFRQTENMPIVSIVTESGEDIVTKDYMNAVISVSNCDEKYVLDEVSAEVKVRGNATAGYAKKPFRIKFNKKQYMLGLNDDLKAKSWVLLAEYGDSSSMKQSLALYLGQGILGEDLYCSDFIHVEVNVNGDYRGVYLLVEQQQIDENRVNINEAEEDYQGVDIGYLFELDGYYYGEDPLQQFTINYEHPLTLANGTNTLNFMNGYSIKSDIYSEEQKNYLAKVVKNVYDIVYDAIYREHDDLWKSPYLTLDENGDVKKDYDITTARQAVEKVVNVDSFVKTYILNQIAMDADMGWSSFLLTIDMSETGDKRLTLQAPWDFEHGFGGRNEPFVDAVNQPYDVDWAPMALSNPWLMILSNEDWFRQSVYEEWTKLKEDGLFVSAINMIDQYVNLYKDYYEADHELWYQENYSESNVQNVKDWMQKRLNFLNLFFSTFAE